MKKTSCCISKQRLSQPSSRQITAALTGALDGAPWGDSGWENTGYWSQIAAVYIKRLISVSPDSCVFPHIALVQSLSHVRLCKPTDCSMLGFPVRHQLPELAQTHVQVVKVLEFQLQHQSFQWIFRTNFLYDWLVWSPCSPIGSQESSPTTQLPFIEKH